MKKFLLAGILLLAVPRCEAWGPDLNNLTHRANLFAALGWVACLCSTYKYIDAAVRLHYSKCRESSAVDDNIAGRADFGIAAYKDYTDIIKQGLSEEEQAQQLCDLLEKRIHRELRNDTQVERSTLIPSKIVRDKEIMYQLAGDLSKHIKDFKELKERKVFRFIAESPVGTQVNTLVHDELEHTLSALEASAHHIDYVISKIYLETYYSMGYQAKAQSLHNILHNISHILEAVLPITDPSKQKEYEAILTEHITNLSELRNNLAKTEPLPFQKETIERINSTYELLVAKEKSLPRNCMQEAL